MVFAFSRLDACKGYGGQLAFRILAPSGLGWRVKKFDKNPQFVGENDFGFVLCSMKQGYCGQERLGLVHDFFSQRPPEASNFLTRQHTIKKLIGLFFWVFFVLGKSIKESWNG